MECPKCGKENPDQMKFCGYCGTPFDKATQEVIVPTDFKFQDEDGDGIPDDLPKSLVLVKEGPEDKEIKEDIKEEVKEEKPVVEIVEEPKEEETIPEVKEPAALANMGKPKEEKKEVKEKKPKDKEAIHNTVQLIITIILVILFIIVLFGTLVERGIIKM